MHVQRGTTRQDELGNSNKKYGKINFDSLQFSKLI